MSNSCVSTIYGAGVDCATGGSRNNYGTATFNGKVTFEPGIQCGRSGLWVVLDGVRIGQPYFLFGDATVDIICENLDDKPFDCINGGCIPQVIYKTPGKYANLAACESGCAKDSSCTGECVSAAEIAALKTAANNAQSNCCQ